MATRRGGVVQPPRRPPPPPPAPTSSKATIPPIYVPQTKLSPPPSSVPYLPTYVPTGAVTQGGNRANPRTPTPTSTKTYCYEVYGKQLQLTQQAIDYYRNAGVSIQPCGTTTPTTTTSGNLEARVSQIEADINHISKVQQTYPQVMGTASQKSDADIWAHLDEHVWSNPPYDNPNAISPTVNRLQAEHGYFHDTLQSLGDSLQDAYEHRVGIGQKVDTAVAEHQDFHTKLGALGQADIDAKAHRDSLELKLEQQRKHTHNNGGGGGGDCNCDFWDISCKWNCGWEKYGTIVMLIGGTIIFGILLWLLRPLFSMIGAFKSGGI